ncbi:MAG: hypothetical protein DME76_14015 [Verrucomicrobia bacterium]|nr:MAG: hypothetical protein DME76_14015 [Verrucomicrobiota bacterium]
MLDPQIAGLARRMILAQFEDRKKEVQRAVVQLADQFRTAGALSSGRFVVELRECCAREVEIRAKLTWHALLRVMSNLGVKASEDLSVALQSEVEGYSAQTLPDLEMIMASHKRHGSSVIAEPLSSAWGLAMRKIYVEIDLFVSSLRARVESNELRESQKTTLNIYSPVGVIQTGSGAMTNISYSLDAGERDVLVRALDLVKESLATGEHVGVREEISELIEEARAEVGKPKPNGMRLQSVLTGIAGAIQTAGSLQPAYQALKAALLPLGVFLP